MIPESRLGQKCSSYRWLNDILVKHNIEIGEGVFVSNILWTIVVRNVKIENDFNLYGLQLFEKFNERYILLVQFLSVALTPYYDIQVGSKKQGGGGRWLYKQL